MKRICSLLFISLFYFGFTFGQDYSENEVSKRNAVTVGVLQGGGALVGADVEFLVSDRIGLQVGGGFKAYGCGLNIHFKPTIRSSFVSFQYWHQGIGYTYAQSLAGALIVYRSKKWFTASLGIGTPVGIGPAYPVSYVNNYVFMYSIGFYIPL